MPKMYRTRIGFEKVELLDVLRETKTRVVLATNVFGKEVAENKRSGFANWHHTFDEAKKFLESDIVSKIEHAERSIAHLRERLEEVHKLVDPETL